MSAGPGSQRVKLWEPDAALIEASQLRQFQRWLAETHGAQTESYAEIWEWSVQNLDLFWDSVWEYFDVIAERHDAPTRDGETMPGVDWYPGAQINYAENILRFAENYGQAEAVVGVHEGRRRDVLTWEQLSGQVGALATALRNLGIEPGDRVAAVLPNLPQTLVALLSTASIGAVWSVVNTDFGVKGIRDRFDQIQPKVLFSVDGYQFNGKHHDQLQILPELVEALPSLQQHILIEQSGTTGQSGDTGQRRASAVPELPIPSHSFREIVAEPQEPEFTRVEFNHPLWVLYSSGTTGKPKGIVHGHGGIVLEGIKANGLQYGLGPGDRVYFSAATTWVMWNIMISAMLRGATVITYDGAPSFGVPDKQLQIVADERATFYGTGAAVLAMIEKSGAVPKDHADFSALRGLFTSGSPLPESTWNWMYENVKADFRLGSDSGGTEVNTGFLGTNPFRPVYRSELTGPYLGVDADTFDGSGASVINEVGELVIKQPMPSMPIYLWGDDAEMTTYRDTYFDEFPGVWRQGDWSTRYPDHHFVIHGRSDSTINRGGIRMGSADICQVVDQLEQVQVSMVLGIELTGGDYYMPMFIVPAQGQQLDQELKDLIAQRIRSDLSPRYVPDEFIQAPDVPRTRTGKLMEVPVKKVFQGKDPAAVDREAAADAAVLEWYVQRAAAFAADRTDHTS